MPSPDLVQKIAECQGACEVLRESLENRKRLAQEHARQSEEAILAMENELNKRLVELEELRQEAAVEEEAEQEA